MPWQRIQQKQLNNAHGVVKLMLETRYRLFAVHESQAAQYNIICSQVDPRKIYLPWVDP
jgi:hypothetical protein